MSHSHAKSEGAHAGHGHVGSDEMNLKKIMIIGVLSLVVFAAGIVWAYFIMQGKVAEIRRNGAPRAATEIGKPEIGIVDQVLFSTDNRLDVWKAEHTKRLEGVGWIDKAKGIAHIPIDQAMARVVASPPDIPGEGVPPTASPPVVPGTPPEFTGGESGKSPDGKSVNGKAGNKR